MGLIELLSSLQTADKVAAVLKSSRTDVREKSARAIRRTWRVYHKVEIAANTKRFAGGRSQSVLRPNLI